MIVYKLNVPSWKQGKPLFMTTLQLKYLRLCRKTSDSIAVETLLPWLHVHSHIETKFFQKFIFIKFTQPISNTGWACMGSARIPYLPSFQRIYFSTTEFFPVFVCLFYYNYYYFFYTKLHVGTWTLVVHPQTSLKKQLAYKKKNDARFLLPMSTPLWQY